MRGAGADVSTRQAVTTWRKSAVTVAAARRDGEGPPYRRGEQATRIAGEHKIGLQFFPYVIGCVRRDTAIWLASAKKVVAQAAAWPAEAPKQAGESLYRPNLPKEADVACPEGLQRVRPARATCAQGDFVDAARTEPHLWDLTSRYRRLALAAVSTISGR